MEQIRVHLAKADIVAIDMRILNSQNQAKL
ncbi:MULTISPECIES: hypothetical protein [Providencia]